MAEIPKAPVVRIVKDAGAERISEEAGVALVDAVEAYTNRLAEACIDLAQHADRKTIQPADVEVALKHF